jgi:type IV secretory pathway VirB3-like protein
MNDWAPPLIAAALFWLLSPGMIFQLPGKNSPLEFMNMKTTIASIFVHAVIYGLLLMLFLISIFISLEVDQMMITMLLLILLLINFN